MDILTARRSAGLTQQQLADKLGVSRVSVANWEAATNPPQPRMAKRIAEVLGITLDDVYRNVEPVEVVAAGQGA